MHVERGRGWVRVARPHQGESNPLSHEARPDRRWWVIQKRKGGVRGGCPASPTMRAPFTRVYVANAGLEDGVGDRIDNRQAVLAAQASAEVIIATSSGSM